MVFSIIRGRANPGFLAEASATTEVGASLATGTKRRRVSACTEQPTTGATTPQEGRAGAVEWRKGVLTLDLDPREINLREGDRRVRPEPERRQDEETQGKLAPRGRHHSDDLDREDQ
jgi:hypothetical protein